MKKRIFALALALCMMLSAMPTSFAGNGFLTDDSKAAPQSGVLTGTSKYYRQDGILYNTGSQSGASYSLPSGTLNAPTGILTLDENVNSTTTLSGSGISAGTRSSALVTDDKNGLELSKKVTEKDGTYTITLEAYVTGEQIKSSVTTTKPMDIILVLDTSKEMVTKTYVEVGTQTFKQLYDLAQAGNLFYEKNGSYYAVTVTNVGNYYWVYTGNGNADGFGRQEYKGPTLYKVGAGNDGGAARFAAMKTAANYLINEIAGQTFAPGVTPTRIALVKYNSDASVLSGSKTDNEGALVPVTSDSAQTLTGLVSGLSVDTTAAANCNLGLAKAKNIFQDANGGAYADRDRVVILLSAGVFGSSGSLSESGYGKDGDIAMDCIRLSSILKIPRGYQAYTDDGSVDNDNNQLTTVGDYTYGISFASNVGYYGISTTGSAAKTRFENTYGRNYSGCGATVYCIGIDMPASTQNATGGQGDIADRINEVMYRVSSHRPDGTHVSGRTYNSWESYNSDWNANYPDAYTRNLNKRYNTTGYFLTADNASDLIGIFESIKSDITTGGANNTTLTSETVVKDVISQYFEIPSGSTVSVYTADYKGTDVDNITADDWEERVPFNAQVTESGNTITVTNFDFSENWVGPDGDNKPRGKKLVIEIPIEPKTGFLGGNGVPTNDDANAGIYLADKLIENFPNTGASTNVPVADVTVEVTDKNIYLSQTLDDSGLLADATVKVGSVKLNMTDTTTYGLEAWQYAYVTISTNVATNTGAKWTDDEVPFTLTCTVKTKDETVVKSDGDTTNVNVFKPVVTFQDSTIYLGATPAYEAVDEITGAQIGNYQSAVWKHETTVANVSKMGTAPGLTFNYAPEKTAVPTDCGGVDVTAAIEEKNVTQYVTFVNGESSHAGLDNAKEFTVHVVKPVITSEDITIYLSNTVDLNGQMTEAGNWVCGHTGSEPLPAKNGETRLAPTIDYTFMVGSTPVSTATAYQPLGCTEIKATATVNGKNAPISTDTAGKDYSTFQIHVLKPTFTVTCTDLWADYGTNVTLANHLNTTVTGWSDSIAEHTGIPIVTGSEPTVFTYTYEVKDVGEKVVTTHTVTENDADFTVELASFKIGALDCGTCWSEVTVNKVDGADFNHNFTIHTNKFDLTIHKTWNGADVYKQDAIFTVSSGLGEFQVVLPAGQESITVKNLLCGQDYTVTEDSNWTWRWGANVDANGKEHVTVNGKTCLAHRDGDNEPIVATSVPSHQEVEAEFTNSLINRLWFSFCKLVQNIFGVGKGE